MKASLIPLATEHDRSEFDSGDPEINLFLRARARQGQTRGLMMTDVALDGRRVVGYVTVTATQLLGTELAVKGLPRTVVPLLLLARMGVDRAAQRGGLGAALVERTLERAREMRGVCGCVGVLVDPTQGRSSYYARFGFRALPLDPRFATCDSPMLCELR